VPDLFDRDYRDDYSTDEIVEFLEDLPLIEVLELFEVYTALDLQDLFDIVELLESDDEKRSRVISRMNGVTI